MVTIRVTGGIGNQLFQYALGFSLKHKYGKMVQYDTSFYNQNNFDDATHRELAINIFNINGFEQEEYFKLSSSIFSKTKRFIQRHILPYHRQSYVCERQLSFDADIHYVKDNVYLDGYWQSPKYFDNVELELRRQLIFKENISSAAKNIANKIVNANNSVSLHVRRSDYLSKYSHIYHIQNAGYYIEGLNFIKSKLQTEDLKIFVFSDDMDWCKENIKIPDNLTFVDEEHKLSYEDMILMSHCQHHIIANSTYSWWGAWLNNKSEKIVIAPKTWFVEKNKNELYLKSIYPPSWICL